MELEFGLQGVPFESQPSLSLTYKGVVLEQKYIPDFVVFGKVVVELKTVKELTEQHRAQLINYLHSTGMKVGLLVNFAHYPDVQIERFAV